MNHFFSFAFNAGVDIYVTQSCQIWSYEVTQLHSRNLLRCFITAVLQASAEIPCCLVYRSPCKR